MVIFKHLNIPTEKQICFSHCFDALCFFSILLLWQGYWGRESERKRKEEVGKWSKEQLKLVIAVQGKNQNGIIFHLKRSYRFFNIKYFNLEHFKKRTLRGLMFKYLEFFFCFVLFYLTSNIAACAPPCMTEFTLLFSLSPSTFLSSPSSSVLCLQRRENGCHTHCCHDILTGGEV